MLIIDKAESSEQYKIPPIFFKFQEHKTNTTQTLN
jgi:hypothetical protein